MMLRRFASIAVLMTAIGMPALTYAQGAGWKQTRTPDGQPDLQGVWTNMTITPFERPANVTKEFYTREELAAVHNQFLARGSDDQPPPSNALLWLQTGALPKPGTGADVHFEFKQFGLDPAQSTYDSANLRTSLVIDPQDGKIPSLSAEGKKREAARVEAQRHRGGTFDAAQNLRLGPRCIITESGAGTPFIPPPFLGNYHIVQAPGFVVIVSEMNHDARIIHLDRGATISKNIRQYLGHSRGRWEGDTLVVETTNFTDKAPFFGSSENMRLVERFRRVAEDRISYTFTVEDPSTWTRPWTAEIPFVKTTGPVYEYACHEGNYAMVNQLRGARAQEAAGQPATTGH